MSITVSQLLELKQTELTDESWKALHDFAKLHIAPLIKDEKMESKEQLKGFQDVLTLFQQVVAPCAGYKSREPYLEVTENTMETSKCDAKFISVSIAATYVQAMEGKFNREWLDVRKELFMRWLFPKLSTWNPNVHINQIRCILVWTWLSRRYNTKAELQDKIEV